MSCFCNFCDAANAIQVEPVPTILNNSHIHLRRSALSLNGTTVAGRFDESVSNVGCLLRPLHVKLRLASCGAFSDAREQQLLLCRMLVARGSAGCSGV